MLAPVLAQFLDSAVHSSLMSSKHGKALLVNDKLGPVKRVVDLPPELWTAVFLQTDSRTILRCCAVCHRFNDIIEGSVELQYRIELTVDGMIDGPPSSLSIGERLTRLRALRRSWATLQWTSKITVPMPGPCHAYELVGGVFCKIHHSARHRYSSRHLTAAWLPSALDTEGQMLVRDDVGLPTRDFAVDPSQDLIIYFRGNDIDALPALVAPGAVELHVRALSTNEVHPDARSATLRMPVLLPVTNAFMQIVDDIVGMLYFIEPERPHITLWNWKTGKVVVNQSTFHIPPNTWDFSFISNRAFFVTTVQTYGTIDIFTFDGDPTESDQSDSSSSAPSFEPSTTYRFITQPKSNVTHVASLHLPPTLPHIRVVNLSTHTGPFLARPPSGRPFVAANEERTHVFSVQYVNPNPDAVRRQMRYCVFLKNSTLEKYIKKHQSRSGTGAGGERLTGPLVVPWEAWGRENTRFMVHHWNQFEWLRYVHGHRVVLPAPRNGRAMMYVLDFNVHDTVRQNQYYRVDDGDTTDTSKADAISIGAPPTPKPSRNPWNSIAIATNGELYRMPTVGHSEEEELDNTGEDDDGPVVFAPDPLQIMSFSRQQFAMHQQRLRQRNTGSKRASLVTEPSVEEYPLFFSAPFETALPYRELQHEQEVEYSGIMVDEERIVGLEYPAFLNGDMKDIHVFT
ncbi:hypothetical protein M404DRAFT_1009005, partial [Pisolithus tinctorius Marx 270]